MLTQGTIGMFRDNQMSQDKALFENNGLVLVKSSNEVLRHLVISLRANREAVACGVAPFGKDKPFPTRRALHPTTSRFAEQVNGTLREHRDGLT